MHWQSVTHTQDTATSVNRLSPKHVTYAKSVNFLKVFNSFFTMAPRKELLSQLTHRGFICYPLLLLWGKSPEAQSI
jgi:hypothetical protein